jgi:hypothetical protein
MRHSQRRAMLGAALLVLGFASACAGQDSHNAVQTKAGAVTGSTDTSPTTDTSVGPPPTGADRRYSTESTVVIPSNDSGLLGTLDAPFGAAANATQLDISAQPDVPFTPLTLAAAKLTALWELNKAQIAFVYDDPTYGHFYLAESASTVELPPAGSTPTSTDLFDYKIIQNAKGEPAALTIGNRGITVDWTHDGVNVNVFGPTGQFSEDQAKAVTAALK